MTVLPKRAKILFFCGLLSAGFSVLAADHPGKDESAPSGASDQSVKGGRRVPESESAKSAAATKVKADKGAPETPSSAAVQASNAKAAAELERASASFGANSGKLAVAKRLEALFKGSANPIVQTREFKPEAPYLRIYDIPGNDALSPPRSLIIYRLRFMQADTKTQDAIEGLVGEAGTVEISESQNTVIINLLRDRKEAVRDALMALDQPLPQILVETQIVEILVEHGEERDVQMEYSRKDGKTGTTDTYGYNLTSQGQANIGGQKSGFNFYPVSTVDSDGGSKQFKLALNWLASSTDAKVLASPNVIANLGAEAKMTTGEDIPYAEAAVTNTAVSQNIKFKKTGINLTIKPVIINSDTVRLEIKPEIILAVRYQTFEAQNAQSTVPVVSIRNISTTLTAADGEIIMLGGLYSSEITERLRKTPFLSDIPLIGELFTAKSSSINDKQLLFFMKIHILKSPYSVMLDMEKNAAEIQDIGRAVRDSGTLFKVKSQPEVKDQKSFFSFDSLWKSKLVNWRFLGNEAGEEKRPAPRRLKNASPAKTSGAQANDKKQPGPPAKTSGAQAGNSRRRRRR